MKRTSEHVEQWRKDLPKVKALAPYGKARLCARFRLQPTHPDCEKWNARFYEWGMRSGLFTEATANDLRRSRMGHLGYWLSPHVSEGVRWICGTFNLWVIAIDDAVVEQGGALDDLKRACDEVLRTGQTANTSAFCRFLADLRDQIIDYKCDGLIPQIADQIEISFDAWKEEQRYLHEDRLPRLAEYLNLRVGNPCLYATIHSERCEKGLLPHDKPFCERLDKIAKLVNIIISLNGDILGLQRDVQAEFPINVIPVIALDFDVDLITAYHMSLSLLDIYKAVFDSLVIDVCQKPGPYPEAAAQAFTLAQWLDGFHTWHITSPRHGAPEVPAELDADVEGFLQAQEVALLRAVKMRSGKPEGHAAAENMHPGGTGLGTSALRLAESLHGAEMLREWAISLLGWSTPSDPPKPRTDAAAPFTEIKPTGIGHGAAQLRESLAVAAVSPSPPAIVEFKPTGLGNAAGTLAALATTQSQSKSPGPSNDAPGANPPIPGLTGLGTSGSLPWQA